MDREILEFKIDAYTPETLPMARLAEYLAQLSVLFGSREAVHFKKVGRGSAVLETWVDQTESSRVISRVRSAPTPAAPEDARRAYQRIDAMLRENRAVAVIKRKKGTRIIDFPGRKLPEPKPIVVTEYAEVDGVIIRVGGLDNTIPVHLQSASGENYPCQVRDRSMARELAPLLYGDPVRVRGKGEWERTSEGVWKLLTMTIEAWEILDQATPLEVFERLRAIPGNGWKDVKEPQRELRRIRDGG